MKKLKVPKMSIKKVKTYEGDKPKKKRIKAKGAIQPGKITHVKTKGSSKANRIDMEAMMKEAMSEGTMKKKDAQKKKLKTWKGY